MHNWTSSYSCLDSITLYNPQRNLFFYAFLDNFTPGSSSYALGKVPVSRFVQNHLKLSNGDDIHFWCIEWNIFQQREEVFIDPSLREQMELPWKEFRPPLLQALGKTEEELTWEEDLQVFFI